jgi:hypothetical protein
MEIAINSYLADSYNPVGAFVRVSAWGLLSGNYIIERKGQQRENIKGRLLGYGVRGCGVV